MRNVTVLIAGSGNITGLNIARAMAWKVDRLVGYDCTPAHTNPSNPLCHQNHQVARAASPAYASDVMTLVKELRPQAIIASNDHDVRALIALKPELDRLGVDVNGLGPNTVKHLNKRSTSQEFTRLGILTPRLWTREEALKPYVVRKELVGSGQKYTYFVMSDEDALRVPEERWKGSVITEFITGDEYTVDVLCSSTSAVLSVVPRLRHEVRAGIVHFGEIVQQEDVIRETTALASVMGLTGVNCVQCIVDPMGDVFFFEVNPRPGSGLDLTTRGGVNMPLAWLDSIMGHVPPLPEPDWGLKMVRYHDGYFFK